MAFTYGKPRGGKSNAPHRNPDREEGDGRASAPGDQYPGGQPNPKTPMRHGSGGAAGGKLPAGAKTSSKDYSGSGRNHSPKGGKGY